MRGIEYRHGEEWIDVDATRARTLPDTVGPGMRLLLVGLNPSEYAADAGAGFARPGNRFWPAALAAGLVTRTHDPFHALRVDGVGMTDLVKRATPRADMPAVQAGDEPRGGLGVRSAEHGNDDWGAGRGALGLDTNRWTANWRTAQVAAATASTRR